MIRGYKFLLRTSFSSYSFSLLKMPFIVLVCIDVPQFVCVFFSSPLHTFEYICIISSSSIKWKWSQYTHQYLIYLLKYQLICFHCLYWFSLYCCAIFRVAVLDLTLECPFISFFLFSYYVSHTEKVGNRSSSKKNVYDNVLLCDSRILIFFSFTHSCFLFLLPRISVEFLRQLIFFFFCIFTFLIFFLFRIPFYIIIIEIIQIFIFR